ncbi:TetR/AcrR family transcriptional regulator [Nocardia thailandica]|uniref:TetR/AcrR family transcriptional regulator n=1 Tax=Nocardia thailandica TaxID=257275 RepID=A0ABW6PTP2_9NOCA
MPKVVDHEQRRRAIGAAACQVIAARGLADTSLRDIAAAAGCTTGMLTHYFADKRAVLRYALGIASSAVARRITALAAEGAGVFELLCQCLPMDEARGVEWRVWIAFWDGAAHDPELAAEQRARYQGWREALEVVLVAAGHRAGPALAEAAESLMIVIDGIGLQAVYDPDRFTPVYQRRLLRRHAEPVLAALDGAPAV